jgi:hypothetical protein
MNYLGGNQVVIDLDSRSTHDMLGPFRMVVRGFSRYAETAHSLPLLEQIKLVIVADFVVESFLPGNLPVTGMRLIGHADTDPEREHREPGFLQRISEKRASEIARELKNRIAWATWMYSGRSSGPRPDQIRWLTSGVGDSQPDEENMKHGKTHANMIEADRKLNRRVRIFLEPGTTPVLDPDDARESVLDATRKWWQKERETNPKPTSPLDPTLPGPQNKAEYIRWKCGVLEQLKKFDVDTAASTLKDLFLKDPSQTSDWTNSVRQMVDEIDKRRKEGEKEWWRDEDCPQEPPSPVSKPRLIVEPRTVTLKRGGAAMVKVSVVDRPFAGSIEVELRLLPAKVAAPRRFIPSYQNFVEIPLDVAPDAPASTERWVFADGYYPKTNDPKGVKLQSDPFTVVVQ